MSERRLGSELDESKRRARKDSEISKEEQGGLTVAKGCAVREDGRRSQRMEKRGKWHVHLSASPSKLFTLASFSISTFKGRSDLKPP